MRPQFLMLLIQEYFRALPEMYSKSSLLLAIPCYNMRDFMGVRKLGLPLWKLKSEWEPRWLG